MEKISVSAVSYLNTKPFLFGLQNSPVAADITLSLDIPSVCAEKLKKGEVDIGLVPVAILPEIKEAAIISEFCIGAEQAVRTVCIFSDKPLEEIQAIYLDYHSRTSVELARILLRDYWKVNATLIKADAGYEEKIKGGTAGLIIGDRAVLYEHRFRYRYDLAEAWIEMTGLPFVFAVWLSNKALPDDFLYRFNVGLKLGIENIDKALLQYEDQYQFPGFSVKEYLTNNISYQLDKEKKKGLHKFLSMIR